MVFENRFLLAACQQQPTATVTPEDRPTEPVRSVDEPD